MPFHVKRDPPASGPLLGPDDAMRQRRSATRHLQVTAATPTEAERCEVGAHKLRGPRET